MQIYWTNVVPCELNQPYQIKSIETNSPNQIYKIQSTEQKVYKNKETNTLNKLYRNKSN